MKLAIDLKKCARTGQCYYMHPELVCRGADDWPEVIVSEPAAAQREAAEDAVDLCPQGAVVLEFPR